MELLALEHRIQRLADLERKARRARPVHDRVDAPALLVPARPGRWWRLSSLVRRLLPGAARRAYAPAPRNIDAATQRSSHASPTLLNTHGPRSRARTSPRTSSPRVPATDTAGSARCA